MNWRSIKGQKKTTITKNDAIDADALEVTHNDLMANGSNIVGDGGIDATIQQQSLDDIPTNLQKQQAEAKTIRVAKGAISGD